MPARKRSEQLQDEFDDHEEVVGRYLATVRRVCADGRVDSHELTEVEAAEQPIHAGLLMVRGGLSCVAGAFRIIGAIANTHEITPKVERTIREIARDTSNVVAFRSRDDGEFPPAA